MAILTKPPYPMLARVGRLEQLATAIADGYIIEPKLDGIRCMATVDHVAGRRTVRLFNRQRTEITGRFPDVVTDVALKVAADGVGGGLTLDGELYIVGAGGLADFQLIQTRANRVQNIAAMAEKYPARFGVFDVLRCRGEDVTGWTLDARRVLLMEVAGRLAVATYTQDEADALAARHVGEGLMIKHRGGRYYAGVRDANWLKCKWLREVEAVVGGVTHGIGRRAETFGGLLMGVPLPEDREGTGRLKYIGCVGTGFTDARLRSLMVHLRMLKTTECPFSERGADWDTMWFVRPIMKARVAFAEYTREEIMRFPRFLELL